MAKVQKNSLPEDRNPDTSTADASFPARSQDGELYAQVVAPIQYSGPPTSDGVRPLSVTIQKPGTSSTVSFTTFTTYDFPDYFGTGKNITPAIVEKILKYDRTRPGELVGLELGDLKKYREWLATEPFKYNCFGFAVGSEIGDGKTPIGWLQPDGSFSTALDTEFYPTYRHSIQKNANYNAWIDKMFRENKIQEGDLVLFRQDNSPIHAAIAVKDNGVAYLLHKPGQQPLMRTSMGTAIKFQYPNTSDIVIYRPR